MNLHTALDNYTTSILGAVAPLALVVAVGLVVILVLYGALARR